ncbi:SGNH/GDSL hydrolase family protein [Nocardioides sp.]|uniref:SGNH/GDSL hydrolase family protein n=1 Tax=Nocardioides sp. TaxID=35761 RepID=UPI0027250AB0|nr:SGNH/GDSL hydrolase family protein [Nocardioides sp.]MDO9454956.1 SGNH/GDSL hydrolase family protein [Nocardioides sp.]
MIAPMNPGDRRWPADVGLAVLAVAVVAFAAFVVVRGPVQSSADEAARSDVSSPTVEPSDEVPTGPSTPTTGPADPAGALRVLALGDETLRVAGKEPRWVTRLGEGRWKVDLRARPQSGYLAIGPAQACGLPACPNVATMLAVAEKQPAVPDVVLVSAGAYDLELPPDEVEASTTEVFTNIRAAYPDAVVVALLPLGRGLDPQPEDLARVTALVRTQAERIGATAVDPGQPFAGDAPQDVRIDRGGDRLLSLVQRAVDEALAG